MARVDGILGTLNRSLSPKHIGPICRRVHPSGLHDSWGVEGRHEGPLWSFDGPTGIVRKRLTRIIFKDEKFDKQETNGGEVALRSGVYELKIRYVESGDLNVQSGLIIGEIEFDNLGYVLAEGVDWDRLLAGGKQYVLPYGNKARGKVLWHRRRICEAWRDGDVLTFRIDTDFGTVSFQRGDSKPLALINVLAFSNNRKYPDYLRLFAYCGTLQEVQGTT